MARSEFPKRIRDAAITRANGHCEKCKAVLKKGEAEVDHILPDGLGGKPELVNAQTLCRVCHAEKTTRQDTPAIRKAERVRKRDTGVTRPKQTIQSAPFRKANRPTAMSAALPPLPPRNMYETRNER